MPCGADGGRRNERHAFSFALAAMLVPHLSEFDEALGRTKLLAED